MRSRCRVALRPRSAIQRDSRSRAALVAEAAASGLRPRLLWLETRWVMVGAARAAGTEIDSQSRERQDTPPRPGVKPATARRAATVCPSRRSGGPLRLLLPRLVRARFRTERDGEAVPAVDGHRDHPQLDQLLLAELPARALV